jgi:hypothetical protein
MFDRGLRASRLIAATAAMSWLLLLPSAAFAEGGCAVVAGVEDGIGGTGLGGDEDGVGGTGLGGDEDGVGGTGVLGTITGFGSVCINGLEVHYRKDVPVSAGGRSATPEHLAPGQVVWIVASKRERKLVADSITVVTELVGRVSAVDSERRTLEVAGESIDVLEGAVVFGVRGGELRLTVGNDVEVSGLRRPDGRIAASRIDRAKTGSRAIPLRLADLLRESPDLHWLSIEGYLGAQLPGASFALGGIEIDASALKGEAREPEERVWVRGELDGSVLRAERIVPEPGAAGAAGEVAPLPGMGAPGAKPGRPRPPDVERDLEPDVATDPKRRPEVLSPDVFEVPIQRELPIEPEIPEIPEIPEVEDIPIDLDRLDVFDGAIGR